MAKKKPQKSIISKYAPKIMALLLATTEKNGDMILSKINDIMHIRRNIFRYVMAMIITVVALVLVLDGAGLMLEWYMPGMPPGTFHIIIGLLLIISIIVYVKTIS